MRVVAISNVFRTRGLDGRDEGVLVRGNGMGLGLGGRGLDGGIESRVDGVRMNEWTRRGWGCRRIVSEGLEIGAVYWGLAGRMCDVVRAE